MTLLDIYGKRCKRGDALEDSYNGKQFTKRVIKCANWRWAWNEPWTKTMRWTGLVCGLFHDSVWGSWSKIKHQTFPPLSFCLLQQKKGSPPPFQMLPSPPPTCSCCLHLLLLCCCGGSLRVASSKAVGLASLPGVGYCLWACAYLTAGWWAHAQNQFVFLEVHGGLWLTMNHHKPPVFQFMSISSVNSCSPFHKEKKHRLHH